MKPAKHIGIVAVSAEGAALCYRTICAEGAALLGPHSHPEVTMHTYPHADYIRHVHAGRWDEVGRLLRSSAGKLAGVGAELLVCPDNTVHLGLGPVRAESPVPWLHIAEEVAAVAAECGYRRVGRSERARSEVRTDLPGPVSEPEAVLILRAGPRLALPA
jgi:aspartate racemase